MTSTNDTPTARLAELLAKLREQVDTGRRTIGGGSISSDGTGYMWGGDPILAPANRDGHEAADAITSLLADLAAKEGSMTSQTIFVDGHLPDCMLAMSDWDKGLFTEAEIECSCDFEGRARAEIGRLRSLEGEAQFLCDRLDSLEWMDDGYADVQREYFGHVEPSHARLKALITTPEKDD